MVPTLQAVTVLLLVSLSLGHCDLHKQDAGGGGRGVHGFRLSYLQGNMVLPLFATNRV